jgi:hypothetical protein
VLFRSEGVNPITGQLNRTSYLSTDGITWRRQTLIPTSTGLLTLFVVNNRLFMANGYDNLAVTTDMITFTPCNAIWIDINNKINNTTNFRTTSGDGGMPTSIVYDNRLNIYIMTAFAYTGADDKKTFWWSDDSINWNAAEFDWKKNDKYSGFNYLVYAFDIWWASSYNDGIPISPGNPNIVYSIDGKKWFAYANPNFETFGSLSSTNNYNLIMKSYFSPYNYYSYDGTNWNLLDNANNLNKIYLSNLPSKLNELKVSNDALIANQLSLNPITSLVGPTAALSFAPSYRSNALTDSLIIGQKAGYGKILTSIDGDTFTVSESGSSYFNPDNGQISAIANNGSYFLAGGTNNKGTLFAKSLDSITWTPISGFTGLGGSRANIDRIRWIGNMWYMLLTSYTNNTVSLYTSSNGESWTQLPSMPNGVSSIAGNDSILVGCGTNVKIRGQSGIYYSTDKGVTWLVAPGVDDVIFAVGNIDGSDGNAGKDGNGGFYEITYNGRMFIATGCGSSDGSVPLVIYSTDGINWIRATLPLNYRVNETTRPVSRVFSSYWNGNMWLINSQWEILYSVDGEKWTLSNCNASMPFNRPTPNGIAWYKNKWYALSESDGTLWTSSDGIDWTKKTQNNTPIFAWGMSIASGLSFYPSTEYDTYLPLTVDPTPSTLLVQSSTSNLEFDIDNGLAFTDHPRNIGSTKFLTLSLPSYIKTPITSGGSSMTVFFSLSLADYRNINSLRIFTQGNKNLQFRQQYNHESIKIQIGNDRKIAMDITTENQKSTTFVTKTTVSVNKWYFVAYTISASSVSTTVSFYIYDSSGKNLETVIISPAPTNPSIVNMVGTSNNNYKTSVNFPTTINNAPSILYDDFQFGDRFRQDGYGMNGYVADYTLFTTVLSNSDINKFIINELITNSGAAVIQPVFNNNNFIDQYTLIYNILGDFKNKIYFTNFIVDSANSSQNTIKNLEFTPNGVNIYMNSTILLNDLYGNPFLPSTPINYVHNNSVNYEIMCRPDSLISYNNHCVPTSTNYSESNCQIYNNMIYVITIPGNYFMTTYPSALYSSPYANNSLVNSLVQLNNFIDQKKLELILRVSTQVTESINNLFNTLTPSGSFNTPASTNALLNQFSSVTLDQPISITIELPAALTSTFSDSETYPIVNELITNNPDTPMFMSTTTKNQDGNESVDISQVPSNSDPTKPVILIVPSLIEGSIVEVGGINILRGGGSYGGNSTQLSIDNGINWQKMGDPITIGDRIFYLSGIGSPVIFTVVNRIDRNPVTVLDYLLMYSYFFAMIGAIYYSINSFIPIESTSSFYNVIFSRNGSIAFNIYVSVCGFISICIWLNLNLNFIISSNLFNQNVVVT